MRQEKVVHARFVVGALKGSEPGSRALEFQLKLLNLGYFELPVGSSS